MSIASELVQIFIGVLNLGVAADTQRGKIPRHFDRVMGTCPNLALPSPAPHLHGATWTRILLLEVQAETGTKTSREKPAETMVPANAVLQAWRTKPTHDGTRVKMPRNIHHMGPISIPSRSIQ